MVSRTRIYAVILFSVLIGSAIAIVVLIPNRPGESDPTFNTRHVEMSAVMAQNQSDFYKGQSINVSLTITVNDTITLQTIDVYAKDILNNRTAFQNVSLEMNITAGTTSLNLSLSPSFFYGQSFAVNIDSSGYQLTSYTIRYDTNKPFSKSFTEFSSNPVFTAKPYPEYDQFPQVEFDIVQNLNSTFSQQGSNLNFTTTESTGFVHVNTTIQTTGYARINYNITGTFNSSKVLIGDVEFTIDNSVGSIPIGIFNGEQQLQLMFNITPSNPVIVNISIPTRKIPVFAVLASDNWDHLGDENLYFEAPSYYLTQISKRYTNAINVSFMHAGTINFDYLNDSTELRDFIEYTVNVTGVELQLGNDWDLTTGTSPTNMGFDILLLFTNKTMDAIGVVPGLYGNALNIAVHARGSLFTGGIVEEIRLTPIWADNLLQHEVAHIFGADDRFLPDYPASIMTKSVPGDALTHIFSGEFWLLQTNWLEIDLQIMWDDRNLYG